jgi:hypothetical protein
MIPLLVSIGLCNCQAKGRQRMDTNDQIKFSNNEFKLAYTNWCNAIEKPEIAIQSSNAPYQDIPEYQAIIDIGEPALDDLEMIMKRKIGMYHMLYLTVIKIKKWDRSDFEKGAFSNQKKTENVLQRLNEEKKR